ncbi:MAG: glycosyltransferase family 4 protein [Candidatus Rokubacteria bacterium]|nr:glycosyltransferase family 4 protein [Candidatus Rokubacteria bacterium]
MERIRVLRVIARLNVGGPALHATLLAERLDPIRYESWLVAGRESPGEANYLTLMGRSLENLTIIPSLGREIRGAGDLRAFLQLYRLMRELRPHIVHTHTAKAGALGRVAARLARVPVVVHTYHGHVLQGYFSRAKTRLFLGIERTLARWTDRLLAVSEAVRQDLLLRRVGSPERLQVVPLGLDLDPFLRSETLRGQLRAELDLSDAPLVGIVARLVPIKRHEDFLSAAQAVTMRIPNCRFVVVGDGELRGRLETRAQTLGLAGRIHFLGWRGDLARIYADLDVVVLTSANEGLPVSLIEAMASARAVVATRVGGVPDLVEDGVTGLLVRPGEPDELARAVLELLADPERRRAMGEAGRKRVYPAFSADRLLADMDRVYGELLREKLGDAL